MEVIKEFWPFWRLSWLRIVSHSGELLHNHANGVKNESMANWRDAQEQIKERTLDLRLFVGTPVAILALIVFLFYWVTHCTRKARLINRFPGPRVWPFIGNFDLLLGPVEDLRAKISKALAEYGEGLVIRAWFATKPVLLVADGNIAEKVLSGYGNVEKGDNYRAFHRVLNQSLVTAPGPKWRQDRRTLNPAVGFQYYEGFLKIFNEQSQILVEILEETFPTGKEIVNLLPYFNRATLDSVFQTVLGSKQTAQRNPQLEFAEKMKGIVTCTRLKLLRPYLDLPIVWSHLGAGVEEERNINDLMNYSKVLIDAKFEEREATGAVSGTGYTRPFLAFLMDGISDKEDIAYHVNALMFAGSETSASAMNYLLFLLALNPGIQDKMITEIDAVIEGEESNGSLNVTQAHLSDLKYTEQCIKEALRLYPPVGAWFRRITKQVLLDDGRIIPVGTQVGILPYEVHRNPEIYPNPEEFDPERFNLEGGHKIPTGWWIPFSHGARNCIGHRYALMQMKTVLSHIFRKFRVETDSVRGDLRLIYGLVLEHTPDILLTLKKRRVSEV